MRAVSTIRGMVLGDSYALEQAEKFARELGGEAAEAILGVKRLIPRKALVSPIPVTSLSQDENGYKYPPSPNGAALVQLRCACDLSVGEVARALGLSTVDYSRLERGSSTLSPAEWLVAFQALGAERARKMPPSKW